MQPSARRDLATSPRRFNSAIGKFARQFSLSALTAQLIWGLNVSTMKLAVAEIDPYLAGLFRVFFAGIILLIVLARTEGHIGLARHHWPRMVLVAVTGMGINTMFWQTGLSMSTATNAALLSSASPIFAMILAVVIGQERLVRGRVIGTAIALTGVVLVIQTDGLHLGANLLGDGFLIGSAITWAAYNVLGVPLLRYYSPLKVTAWSMILGAMAMMLFSPWEVHHWNLLHVSPVAWFGIAFGVIFGSVIAQTLWSQTLNSLGASGTMIYSYLSPVLAVGFAWLLLAERLSLLQAVGATLVLGGVTVSSRIARSRPRAVTA